MTNTLKTSRHWLVWLLRLAALVVVGVGVYGTVQSAFAQLSKHEWTVRPAWLVFAGVVYVFGMAPMSWFWHRTLVALGYEPPLLATGRAYYFGQLGKYVPGKAMVIILRVAAMRRWAPSMRLVILSVFVETLTVMAVGALLAAAISTFVLKTDAYIPLIALGMAAVTGVPTLPPALRWFVRLGSGRFARDDVDEPAAEKSEEIQSRVRGVTFRVLSAGWLAAVVCWVLFATSLWGTLRAIGVDGFPLVTNLPVMIAAVASAVVIGFLSMMPGGLVVRDGILLRLLAPICGEANALVATVLMRLVWLVSEVVACGILYVGARSEERGAKSDNQGAGGKAN